MYFAAKLRCRTVEEQAKIIPLFLEAFSLGGMYYSVVSPFLLILLNYNKSKIFLKAREIQIGKKYAQKYNRSKNVCSLKLLQQTA